MPLGGLPEAEPVAAAARSLRLDRELLAAYLATLHFRDAIEGRKVTILTDHKPLASAFRSPHIAKSDRQQRHWSINTEYASDVRHIY